MVVGVAAVAIGASLSLGLAACGFYFSNRRLRDAVARNVRLQEEYRLTASHAVGERARYSAILANMTEAVVAVDSRNHILFINEALAALFAVPASGIDGLPFLQVIRNGQLDDLLRSTSQSQRSQSAEVTVYAMQEKIFEAQTAPLRQNGERQGVILVLHDITRLRRLEKMRRDFVANVSHELRTPLASIAAAAETLAQGALSHPTHAAEFVAIIEKDAIRLTRLIDDLLDISAIESGCRAPHKEPVHLAQIVAEAVAAMRMLVGRNNVTIESSSLEALPALTADRGQMRQVFMNLIGNAVKFNRKDGKVTIEGASGVADITVSVRDTGIGIPAADLPRIFERFYRVDKARSRELGGTGLGLSIV
ncbi:MAG: ATP-binding protein, partial [Elusimicrobiota bacterium]